MRKYLNASIDQICAEASVVCYAGDQRCVAPIPTGCTYAQAIKKAARVSELSGTAPQAVESIALCFFCKLSHFQMRCDVAGNHPNQNHTEEAKEL